MNMKRTISQFWLDPARAYQENIRNGLIAADPQNLTANAAATINKLKTLDAEFATAAQALCRQGVCYLYDFAYFCPEYVLKAEYLVGVQKKTQPGDVRRVIKAAQLSDLQDTNQTHKGRCFLNPCPRILRCR